MGQSEALLRSVKHYVLSVEFCGLLRRKHRLSAWIKFAIYQIMHFTTEDQGRCASRTDYKILILTIQSCDMVLPFKAE